MEHTINHVSLHVQAQGAGAPSLVFLHYWGGTHRTWKEVVAELGGSHHTVTYDGRGWGLSGPGSGYSMTELADEAQTLIEQLALAEYVLVGHSMGGKVAQLLASRRPVGLVGLVLVAPATPTPTHLPEEACQQQLHAYDSRETILQTISFLCAQTPDAPTVEQIVEDSLSGVSAAKLAWPTAGSQEDVSAELGWINVPTLLLAGEHDRLDSVEQHRREVLSRIAHARLQIIPGSGHLVPIDQPAALARAIAAFVGDLKVGVSAA